jgi:phage terminase large subunit-like protein
VAPASVTSAGQEAAELAESAGLVLDDWQRFALDVALGERADGKWSAFEVGLLVSRQNGKGSVLEARELAGLFLFDEQLILHSAHEFKTAQEAFRRVLSLVENSDHLRKRVARVRTSHGEEGIELIGGARLRFVARSTGSGRGFSGDCVILDEAYNLGAEQMAALLPTLSARPNPQLWYTSSAPMSTSTQLHRVRRRALEGGDARLAFLEWSAEEADAEDDPVAWVKANPALGIRIDAEFVESEMAAMPVEVFRRERLGIPDLPPEELQGRVIPAAVWESSLDPLSAPAGPVAFAVDVTPDRAFAAVAVAARRADGRVHVEVVEHQPHTGWVVARLAELAARHENVGVALDPAGPVGSLIPDLAARGLMPRLTTSRGMAQACGRLLDLAVDDHLRHLGQPTLSSAVENAVRRPLGDAWAWSRQSTASDICPLVAVTVASWLLGEVEADPPVAPPVPRVVSLADL